MRKKHFISLFLILIFSISIGFSQKLEDDFNIEMYFESIPNEEIIEFENSKKVFLFNFNDSIDLESIYGNIDIIDLEETIYLHSNNEIILIPKEDFIENKVYSINFNSNIKNKNGENLEEKTIYIKLNPTLSNPSIVFDLKEQVDETFIFESNLLTLEELNQEEKERISIIETFENKGNSYTFMNELSYNDYSTFFTALIQDNFNQSIMADINNFEATDYFQRDSEYFMNSISLSYYDNFVLSDYNGLKQDISNKVDNLIEPTMNFDERFNIISQFIIDKFEYADEFSDIAPTNVSFNERHYQSFYSYEVNRTVCAGYAQLLVIMLAESGIRSDLVFCTVDGVNHVYNKIYTSEGHFYTDLTFLDTGSNNPKYKKHNSIDFGDNDRIVERIGKPLLLKSNFKSELFQ